MRLSETERDGVVPLHMVSVANFHGNHECIYRGNEKTWRTLLGDEMITRDQIFLC